MAATQLGLSRGKPGEKALGMLSTLDHSIFFYEYVLGATPEKSRAMTAV